MHDSTTVHASPRTNIDNPVSRVDGVLIVLNHDKCVAEVTKLEQRVDESAIVALVEPDAGLI